MEIFIKIRIGALNLNVTSQALHCIYNNRIQNRVKINYLRLEPVAPSYNVP